MTTETIKLQLVQTILNLPEDQLAAVQSLLSDLTKNSETKPRKKQTPVENGNGQKRALKKQKTKNPMLALIGCVSYNPPQKSIDEELYGDNPL